jgi:type III restriction enzyme
MTKEDQKASKIFLVNSLRPLLSSWREEGYKNVSDKTKRLLLFWFEEEHELANGTPFKFWGAQKEAIETLIYCHEVLKTSNLYELNRALGDPLPAIPSGYLWPKYAFKMATGSGKTMVMALAIVWAYFNGYTKNFLVIAPNLIVLDRLGTDFVDGKVFKKFPLIPPEWKADFQMDFIGADDPPSPKKSAVLFLTNIQKLYEREEKEAENPVQKLLGKKPPDEIKISLEQRREALVRLENLMVINDEAHHVHDEDLEWKLLIG